MTDEEIKALAKAAVRMMDGKGVCDLLEALAAVRDEHANMTNGAALGATVSLAIAEVRVAARAIGVDWRPLLLALADAIDDLVTKPAPHTHGEIQ